MPLGPKQQPPYYEPEAMPEPGSTAKFKRLAYQYENGGSTQTSGTNETQINLFSVPSNTLEQTGDGLRVRFTMIQASSGNNQIVRFKLDGTTQHAKTTSIAWQHPISYEIDIIRTSTSTALLVIRETFNNSTTITLQEANTLDFTGTLPIQITGQCTTGQLQSGSFTVDQEKL